LIINRSLDLVPFSCSVKVQADGTVGGSGRCCPAMASFFKPVCDIEIRLDGEDARDMVEFKTAGKERKEKAPLYKDGESVKGSVIVRPKDGKKLEHTGIKVNLIGSIGMSPFLPVCKYID